MTKGILTKIKIWLDKCLTKQIIKKFKGLRTFLYCELVRSQQWRFLQKYPAPQASVGIGKKSWSKSYLVNSDADEQVSSVPTQTITQLVEEVSECSSPESLSRMSGTMTLGQQWVRAVWCVLGEFSPLCFTDCKTLSGKCVVLGDLNKTDRLTWFYSPLYHSLYLFIILIPKQRSEPGHFIH